MELYQNPSVSILGFNRVNIFAKQLYEITTGRLALTQFSDISQISLVLLVLNYVCVCVFYTTLL
jgi:hypothetical protein